MSEENIDVNELFRQRLEKVKELQDAGVDPYGAAYDNVQKVAVVRKNFVPPQEEGEYGESVNVAGRLLGMRIMGKSIFADVQDSSGKIQLFVGKNALGDEFFQQFKKLDIGDIIGVKGPTFLTRMGELSVRVQEYTLLSKSLRTLPEKFHGLANVEQRYRQRYLDLITNDDSRKVFKQRIEIIREIRKFMDNREFLEVETPMLQTLAGGASATPFEAHYEALNCPIYMRIAPELFLKRLLVGGFERVYEINRNFRNEGLSRRHNPEFTMMELYQSYGDCRSMMELIESLIRTVAQNVVGTLKIEHSDGKVIDFESPWRRATYHELIKETAGDDWFDITHDQRVERAREFKLDIHSAMSDLDITNEVYEKMIECNLIQPTFVMRLPVELLPLAKSCADDPNLVDVFELVINGMEVAPAYSELNNPIIQRKRLVEQFEKSKTADEKIEDKLDEDFLVALEYGMPPAGGMGVGIDRLVMIITGAESIRDVILFPQLKIKK